MLDFIPAANKKWIYSMIFLQVPKTASTSLSMLIGERNLLEKHKGLFQQKFLHHPLFKGHFDTRHCTPEQIFSVFGRQVYEFFSFAVIREPCERLASSYTFGKENKLWNLYGLPEDIGPNTYVDWLYKSRGRQDILILLPQTTWVDSSIFKPTEVLRFEELSKNWKAMLEKHDIKGLPYELPHLNASKRQKGEIFSDESLSKIREIYKKDYELLNY